MHRTLTLPPPVIEEHRGILVVRDDLIEGGTKSRVLDTVLDDNAPEYVYASTVYGYAQIALAVAGRRRGKPVTIRPSQRRDREHKQRQHRPRTPLCGTRIVRTGREDHAAVPFLQQLRRQSVAIRERLRSLRRTLLERRMTLHRSA